jgi:Glutamate/Leucine/Phenylalanine/Valine dehydrogenase
MFKMCQHIISNLIYLKHRDYLKSYPQAKYVEDGKPWSERCDVAFPCASQNEIDQSDALSLVTSGCRIIIEGIMFFILLSNSKSNCLSCFCLMKLPFKFE